MEAKILDIQRLSTEDGPGIRTTVFFKGCNLACKWCHNPESISSRFERYWAEEKCIFCKTCLEACAAGALSFSENGLIFDLEKCLNCGRCGEACPTLAIETKGRLITETELYRELLKDKAYFGANGGVTLSGGEPMLQSDFLLLLLKLLKASGVHTALDTAGLYGEERLAPVLPYLDLVLFDLKFIDAAEHKKWAAADNAQILKNARMLGALDYPKVWVRTPLIPGATATPENIAAIGAFIKESMPNLERWELPAFNNLSRRKYTLLGREWEFKSTELMKRKELDALAGVAKAYFPAAVWTGRATD
ncbi:MAG TPA: glycyl-radical enzyme activating protein [Eubacteriales bacterium]|nr:glycyl-radical enzyme activating protein [Clostridia bacterium]HRR89237.1 glycyl-radical enzyme activating protein [Eubacteriales bacterium]HRU84045.1 glycyl-radical enzyme activating protein [Eubacteriales bacterium]